MKLIDLASPRASADSPSTGGGHGDQPAYDELHNEDVAHETRDVNVRAIVLFAVGLAIVSMIAAAAMVGLFKVFESMAASNDPHVSPVATPATEMPRRTTESPYFGSAPQPRLLTNEPEVLQQLHKREAEELDEYGWVDQGTGVARIPIDAAKKLLLQRGVPARPGNVDPKLGTNAPAYGEASGGRTISRNRSASTASAAPAQAGKQ